MTMAAKKKSAKKSSKPKKSPKKKKGGHKVESFIKSLKPADRAKVEAADKRDEKAKRTPTSVLLYFQHKMPAQMVKTSSIIKSRLSK
jgi:hypothetical protein